MADSPTNYNEEIILAHNLGIEYSKNNEGHYPLDYITKVAKYHNPTNKVALENLESMLSISR